VSLVHADEPRTVFAIAPDGAHIAYQVVGKGPVDLVLVTDWASSIDLMWEQPRIERFLRRLWSIGRLILFADRGQVVVSRTVKDLTAGSGLSFADRGIHELKGIPEPWQLFTLEPNR
jgi:hypothetical protein